MPIFLALPLKLKYCICHNSIVHYLSDRTKYTVYRYFQCDQRSSSYNSFISSLRQRVADGTYYAGGVPMLRQEQDYCNQWFHIILINGNSQIAVRIRLGDLYLVAFQAANGTWYEFRPTDSNPRLFTNTQLLPFTSDYQNDGSARAQTIVGQNQLASAINSLANYNPTNTNNQQYLLSLMVMFPEALRFRNVSDFVYARMHDLSTPDSQIGNSLDRLIHEWGALSMEMRQSDLFASFNEFQNLGTNAAQAATILALVLWSNRAPTSKPAFNTDVFGTNALSDVTTKGRQLVEIFWVQILNIDIFGSSKENYLSIRSNVSLHIYKCYFFLIVNSME
jgi:Ribosome inactivating protein